MEVHACIHGSDLRKRVVGLVSVSGCGSGTRTGYCS